MHKRIVIVLMLVGCDKLADRESEGVALATLNGTLSLGKDVAPPSGKLQVSVLWRDPVFGSMHEPGITVEREGIARMQEACDDGTLDGWRLETPLLEQPVRIDTNFPSGFTVQLTEPPPAEALFEYPDGGGVATASGDLVVYEDRNANGRLDPTEGDVVSPDLVFGSSQGTTPWGIGQRLHYSIVYLTDDSDRGAGDGKAGYSLETNTISDSGLYPVGVQRLSEAMIDLTLDPTTYAQQMACTVMCRASDLDVDPIAFLAGDLGMPVDVDAGVATSVWSREEGGATTLIKRRCTKWENSDNITGYGLELSVVISEDCKETSSVHVVHVGADDAAMLPCPEFETLDESGFPIEP
jgi:hypothetical protein